MPQEFQVLCCFSCNTFQVHQVKKSSKWQCKLCGAKQSVKMVFILGKAGDCRKYVQCMNLSIGQKSEQSLVAENDEFHLQTSLIVTNSNLDDSESKWTAFLDDTKENVNDNDKSQVAVCNSKGYNSHPETVTKSLKRKSDDHFYGNLKNHKLCESLNSKEPISNGNLMSRKANSPQSVVGNTLASTYKFPITSMHKSNNCEALQNERILTSSSKWDKFTVYS